MRIPHVSLFSGAILAVNVILFGLGGCGGDSSTVAPSYTLTAAALSPASLESGNTSSALVTVAPANGYTGSVTLSCSVSSAATPAPNCSFSNPAVTVSAGSSATSMLRVSTATATPGGSYTISVVGHGVNNMTPSNGAQTLTLTAAAVIQHVVIIVQENRTPDNLFHDPILISRGADIASSGVNSLGQSIPLTPIDLGTAGSNPQTYDLDHSHFAFLTMYAKGKMNGANLVRCVPAAACPPVAHPNAQFRYVDAADVQPYFLMAEQYTFADRMFQTNEGPSFPAHQFLYAGTSAPTATSPLFAAENPYQPSGCLGPKTNTVVMIDAQGYERTQPPEWPCFEHPTLSDSLETDGVTWHYYTPLAGSIWTAPDAIEHICQEKSVAGDTICTGPDWTHNVIIPQTQVLTDIANGQLPQVSWVIPTGAESDHAMINDGTGPSWVASIVNAIGNSPYWANTAIIITWDDWGGWYDHVLPKVIDDGVSWGSGYVYGFRVPLVIVSPYAKPAYISHVTHDFGSILKFIETTFNVPGLGYADAAADDLSDCFNLTQSPIKFQTIPAPVDAAFFINDKRAPTDPDDD
jgi:phospholipase C